MLQTPPALIPASPKAPAMLFPIARASKMANPVPVGTSSCWVQYCTIWSSKHREKRAPSGYRMYILSRGNAWFFPSLHVVCLTPLPLRHVRLWYTCALATTTATCLANEAPPRAQATNDKYLWMRTRQALRGPQFNFNGSILIKSPESFRYNQWYGECLMVIISNANRTDCAFWTDSLLTSDRWQKWSHPLPDCHLKM